MNDGKPNRKQLKNVAAELNANFLRFCIEITQNEALETARSLGLSNDQLRSIRQIGILTGAELKSLGHFPPLVTMSINESALTRVAAHFKRNRDHEQLLDSLIMAGATLEILRSLFGLDLKRARRRAEIIGHPLKNGRPLSITDPNQIRTIYQLWNILSCSVPDEARRLLTLAEITKESVGSIWATIKEQNQFKHLTRKKFA